MNRKQIKDKGIAVGIWRKPKQVARDYGISIRKLGLIKNEASPFIFCLQLD